MLSSEKWRSKCSVMATFFLFWMTLKFIIFPSTLMNPYLTTLKNKKMYNQKQINEWRFGFMVPIQLSICFLHKQCSNKVCWIKLSGKWYWAGCDVNLNGGICPIVVRPALWQPVDPSLVYCYEIQGLGLRVLQGNIQWNVSISPPLTRLCPTWGVMTN